MNAVDDLTPEFIRAELEYRRNKQSEVFSWCSTILVAITGGLILLRVPLTTGQQGVLSWAIVVLVAHAVSWIGHNAHLEDVAKRSIRGQAASRLWDHYAPSAGYRSAVLLLGVGALVATWLPNIPANTAIKVAAWIGVVLVAVLIGFGGADFVHRKFKKRRARK